MSAFLFVTTTLDNEYFWHQHTVYCWDMKQAFFLVSKQRKYAVLVKLTSLVAIIIGLLNGYLGVFIPVEYWQILVIFLLISSIANLVRFFTVTAYRKRSLIPVGERDNFILGVDSLSALIVFLITVASAFIVFDVAFQTFFASISVVAVALVLIFRDYISNYLDSFRLMFSTDYRIGDYIKVSEFTKGIITDVSFRATKLKTDEGDILFIPNTKLMTSEVVNYSKTKFKRIIVPFSLPTTSLLEPAAFEANLKKALLEQFPDLLVEDKMLLRFENMKQWQTECRFEASVDQYNFTIEDEITKAVYLCVIQSQRKIKTPKVVLIPE